MLSTLIDFLMNLLRDDDAKIAFAQNPQGALAKHGLEGVSGQDVRDARLIMADNGGARAREDTHRPSSHSDDPVREIQHTTQNFVVDEHHTVNNVNVVTIDDRDTIIIDDSFNSDDDTDVDVTAVQDNSTHTDVDIVKIENPAQDEAPEDEPEPPADDEPVDVEPEPEPVEDEPEPVEDEPEPVEDMPTFTTDVVEDEPEPELAEPLVG